MTDLRERKDEKHAAPVTAEAARVMSTASAVETASGALAEWIVATR